MLEAKGQKLFSLRYHIALKLIFSVGAVFISQLAYAQDAGTQPAKALGGFTNEIILFLFAFVMLTLLLVLFIGSDRLLRVAKEIVRGREADGDDVSMVPTKASIMGETDSKKTKGFPVIKLKQGFDILIEGRSAKQSGGEIKTTTYAVKPIDFIGMSPIPKIMVEEGAKVKAGDKLFFDKKHPEIFYTAPVSGELLEVRRGSKRLIEEVVIKADAEIEFKAFDKADPKKLSKEQVKEQLIESGLWPYIIQRPYNIVANPADTPRNIFISGFDTSPMASNYNYTLAGELDAFQAGIDALTVLSSGKIYLGLNAKQNQCDTYEQVKGVEKVGFEGKHPAGNVGVQIHHIKPINKGEVVWTINPQHVVFIGRLFTQGKYNTQHLIALAGSDVTTPQYYSVYAGANVGEIVNGKLNNDHVRFVSGNVLTGTKVEASGHLSFHHNQLSVIEEGDKYEMLGWLIPSYARPSLSPTFPWRMFPNEEFKVNTNTHGEERAFVVTGQYEEVLPMDVYPQHLLKAIMARDFEKMEGFGIYEVVEEDFALCEFACTSKVDVQEILREGLDYIREQS